jgi:hypothetical protein
MHLKSSPLHLMAFQLHSLAFPLHQTPFPLHLKSLAVGQMAQNLSLFRVPNQLDHEMKCLERQK